MALTLCMVALSEDQQLSVPAIRSYLAAKWPDLAPFADVDERDESILSFCVGSASVFLARMRAGIPWSDLQGPCATSYLWPDAEKILRPHKAHHIVTVSDDANPVELSTLLTQVTASVLATCASALGVYWGNARLVVPRDLFIDFAVEVLPNEPPLPIWVDFRVGQDGERTSAGFTQGMSALGHMEFEAQKSPEPPAELRKRFLTLTDYVMKNGPVIGDGDTVGQDADERIRVVYSDSAFGHKGRVMRLEYETAPAKRP